MTRSVVFRTPGKLDLRAITVFGLNAKPNSTNPIGFFGTGLKYAVAVLARHKFPTTIWVGAQKWTVEPKETTFRDKQFQTIILKRHRKMLPPKEIVLPFTTELGKTWELWQAFRELYANTLDEKGETSVNESPILPNDYVPYTYIEVESEEFVQEYLKREKTFLPDALRQQANVEPVQYFDRPSNFIYWRGMRVQDLKEPSQFTWNVLAPLDLTEDRTAKYEFEVRRRIEEYLRNHAPKDIVTQALSKADTFEHKLNFDYGHYSAPSKQFIEAVTEAPRSQVNENVLRHTQSYLPPDPKPTYTKNELFDKALNAIKHGDWGALEEAIDHDRAWFLELLTIGKDTWDASNAYQGIIDDAQNELERVDDEEKWIGSSPNSIPPRDAIQRIADEVEAAEREFRPTRDMDDEIPF